MKKVFIDLKIFNKLIVKLNIFVIRVIFVVGIIFVKSNYSLIDWGFLKIIRNYCLLDFLSCNKVLIIIFFGEFLYFIF